MKNYTKQELANELSRRNIVPFVRTHIDRVGSLSFCHTMDSAENVVSAFGYLARNLSTEHIWTVFLLNGMPVGVEHSASGNSKNCLFPIREILQSCFLCNANQIILLHNHVSGNVTPSKEDIFITEKMKTACTLLDITLLDHIIIGSQNNHYTSLHEAGYLKN